MPTEAEFIQNSSEAILRDLRIMVNVDCGTANKAGVDRVGTWMAQRCADWGRTVERIPQSE